MGHVATVFLDYLTADGNKRQAAVGEPVDDMSPQALAWMIDSGWVKDDEVDSEPDGVLDNGRLEETAFPGASTQQVPNTSTDDPKADMLPSQEDSLSPEVQAVAAAQDHPETAEVPADQRPVSESTDEASSAPSEPTGPSFADVANSTEPADASPVNTDPTPGV